jgi:hypothetical protein
MGIDPAGEGKDKAVWVVRDNFKAKIVASESISTEKSIAEKTAILMDKLNIPARDVFMGTFGQGTEAVQQLALEGHKINPINEGDKAEDDMLYANIRAETNVRMRDWLRQGGELVESRGWSELKTVKYRRNHKGKIVIMSKVEMQKESIASPNNSDALALTFVTKDKAAKKRQDTDWLKDKKPKLQREKKVSTTVF